jgi:transcriptional regulator with XRE-family HTH domain
MNETYKEDIVDYLIKIMSEKDVRPTDITRRGGLSPSQVSKILNRESPAGRKALDSFAQALSIPVEELYRRANIISGKSDRAPGFVELEGIYHHVSDEKRKRILDFARYQEKMENK